MDLTWDHHPTMCQNAAAFLMFHWSHLHGNVLVVLHFALTSPVNNSRLGPWALRNWSLGSHSGKFRTLNTLCGKFKDRCMLCVQNCHAA